MASAKAEQMAAPKVFVKVDPKDNPWVVLRAAQRVV
jgi:hypothetical protein